MKIFLEKNELNRKDADLVVLPFCEKKVAGQLFDSKDAPIDAAHLLQLKDFSGKNKETLLYYPEKGKEKRVLLLGLGEPDRITQETVRQAYSEVIKIAMKKNCVKINVLFPKRINIGKEDLLSAIAESFFLTNYSFDSLKCDSIKKEVKTEIESIYIYGIEEKFSQLIDETSVICTAVNMARDMVNTNADDKYPEKIAIIAQEMTRESKKIGCQILDKSAIVKEKMGLLLAVNQGSNKDPRLIVLSYKGDPTKKDVTVFVGKGITYDTGGLSLKPTKSMETMKTDMSGAAVCIALIYAIAKLNLRQNVTVVIPSTENAIGPGSYKVGDVFKSYQGTTVEITNTDAEGRLILADAISYAVKNFKPKRLIDLATLTGAIIVALGEEITGFFSNNDEMAAKLTQSSQRTGENIWRMPLFAEYKPNIKSEIADIKNSVGDSKASSTMAALFLEEFIPEKLPWAHLDIAGTAYLSKPKHYHATCATGSCIRLLIDFLKNL